MLAQSIMLLLLAISRAPGGPPSDHARALRAFAETWCVDCHQQPRPKADLDLRVVLDRIDKGETPASLSLLLERLDERDMPPDDEPRPDESAYDDAIFALESIRAASALPARPTARRLSRYEYANTLRDLLRVEIEVDEVLPADEIADGFDNSGDVLSVSPLLLEKYLDIAEYCARRAIALPGDSASTTRRFKLQQLRPTDRGRLHRSVWFLATKGGIVADVNVPAAGEYIVRAKVRGQQAGPELVRMALLLDGESAERFTIDSPFDASETIETHVDLDVGSHVIGASFLNDYYRPKDPDPSQRDRNAAVEWIELEGPIRSAFPTPVQQDLMHRFGEPDDDHALDAMIELLLSRAWRRPVEKRDADALLALSTKEDSPWLRLRRAIVAMLVHPRFLFRFEHDANEGTQVRALDDWEIATRLSYFLWATLPDVELRRAAAMGELTTSDGRRTQVERMLRDDRSLSLGRHFATQWLQIRSLSDKTPDPELFPGVSEQVLRLMHEETIRFFDEVLRERLSIDRLLDANWTWLNEPLARHYGVEGVVGRRMRKVSLEGEENATGILRHGSVLLATSNPTRTSPVKRGKWILEALLDDAPPPPPPGIAGLPDDGKVTGELSLREMLLQHRTDPRCASCHVRMDALGFALEGYDAVGRQRDSEGGIPIDAQGELPDGTIVAGGIGLRDQLLQGSSQVQFRRSLAKHLMIYALGRGLDWRDEPMLEAIVSALEEDPSVHHLILEIVETNAFLHRPADSAAMMDARSTP